MHPHRPAYDPYADKPAPEQRHNAIRDTHVGSSDPRLARMQASGLPQGHTEPAFDQCFHPKSPLRSPPSSASHDPTLARHAQSHDYPTMPPAVRTYPERAPSDRHYDDYHLQRTRAPYSEQQQQRSPRYPAAPLHAPPYDPASDPRHEQQPYHDYGYPRHPDTNNYHDQQPPYPQHAAYPYREFRRDDMPRHAPMRPNLPSPRNMHPSAQRKSPSREFGHRAPYPNEPAHRSAYPPITSAHPDRHMADLHHDSADPSRRTTSNSSNATAPRSTLASRKRKKQFKYMLERDGVDASKPNELGANEDQNDGDHHDHLKAASGADGATHRKESRKKVKKACVFCKRSHMPCEEARPCNRCVKRGISHLCRDAEPLGSAGAASSTNNTSKGKFGEARNHARARRRKAEENRSPNDQHVPETESESDPESLASSVASSMLHRPGTGRSYDMNVIHVMPGAAAPDLDCRPAMPVSMLLSTERAQLACRPAERRSWPGVSEQEQKEAWNRSMDPGTQHKMKQMLEAGPAAGDLNDIFGEMPTSLLMTPAMANLPEGQSILRPASTQPNCSPDRDERDKAFKRSASASLPSTDYKVDEAGFKLPPRPKHLFQEEMATTSELRSGQPTYSYTYGYAKLARWMHTRFSRESCEQVDRSLSVIRPKLMSLSRSLPEEELISIEDNFYSLLEHYRTNVLETIPVPMIVTRRTGEIYAANSHACNLLQLPPRIFEGGQICHYQLVTERDCVYMWEKYAREATGELDVPPTQTAMLEIDRRLLLFDKPGFHPRTGELFGDGVCEDGSPVVLRKKVIVTFDAKISKHGLPFMVTGVIVPVPEDEEHK